MVLLRRVIGDALRARRQAQHRTLREVSTAANVSLGYLSEIERGQKEASSELLAAICDALGAALSEILRDVSDTLALDDEMRQMREAMSEEQPATVPAPAQPEQPAASLVLPSVPVAKLSVAVHRDGPLRTTLHARPSRDRDIVCVA
jgi:transcriptional regulator with XRE-family HTH domain